MTLLLAWVVYPLVLLALGCALGLLLDRLSEGRLSRRFRRPGREATAGALGVFALIALAALPAGRPESASPEPELAWAFPPTIALLAALLTLCAWQLAALMAARRPRAAAGALLLAAILAAALLPGALAVRGGGLAAYDRLAELREIGDLYAGHGPALLGEEGILGAETALGDLQASKAGAVDLDQAGLPLEEVFAHPILILREGESSRPPLPYRPVARGELYQVWQRPSRPTGPVLHHMALGEGGELAAAPNCSEVVGLGLLALANQLGYPPQSIRIFAAARHGLMRSVVPADARSLCGRPWDWIEAVGRGSGSV